MSRFSKLRRREGKKISADDFITKAAGLQRQVRVKTLADNWEHSCGEKVPYDNRLDAVREALILEHRHKTSFNVYPCGCCGKFHIGGAR